MHTGTFIKCCIKVECILFYQYLIYSEQHTPRVGGAVIQYSAIPFINENELKQAREKLVNLL